MSAVMRRTWLILPFLLCLAGPALSTDVEPFYEIRVNEKPESVTKDQASHIVLTIAAAKDLVLDKINLSGPGWSVVPGAGAFMTITAGSEVELPFTLIPDGTWEKLTLSFEANGQPVTKHMDLSPPEIRAKKYEGTLNYREQSTYDAKSSFAPPTDQTELMPPISYDKLPSYLTENSQLYVPPADKASHPVTLRGRLGFEYQGVFTPFFGAAVHAEHRPGFGIFVMGSTTTDRDGNFSITFQVADGLALNVGFLAVAGNGAFVIMEDNFYERDVYTWRSFTTTNFTGSEINYGDVVTGGPYIGALNITSAISRAYVFLTESLGYSSLPWVDIWWPVAEGSHYERRVIGYNEVPDIYYKNVDTWNAGTHIHEYGHHFIWTQAQGVPADYCNFGAYCDEGGYLEDCGHCEWCPENANVAYTEGAPSWIADYVCKQWVETELTNPIRPYYGVYGVYSYDYSAQQDCLEPFTTPVTPWYTEAVFAGLLHDIVSPEYDNDMYYDADHADDMTASATEVLTVLTVDEPISPWQFVFDFKARYPQYTEELWQTCRNNGLSDLDNTPPIVGTISSGSHPLYSVRSDDTIGIDIAGSSDDFSGIAGYCLDWHYGSVIEPGYYINRPYVAHHDFIQTDSVPPGIYYLSLRAVDHAGHWSEDFESYGPVTIRNPDPSDLRPEPWNADWDYPLVPKDSQVPVWEVVHADTGILGYPTYWNGCVTNDGEVYVNDHNTAILLDGVEIDSYSGGVPGWGDHAVAVNQGPFSIQPGRHTLEIATDYGEIVAEPDEANNNWGKQWIWNPLSMAFNTYYGRSSPPSRSGGWDSIDSSIKWFNCFGLRFETAGADVPSNWAAVWVRSQAAGGDLDVRLHDSNNTATGGYAGNLGYSTRPAGCLDAVLVNSANRLATSYDVGVIRTVDDIPQYFYSEAAYGVDLVEGATKYKYLPSGEGLDMFAFTGSPGKNYTVFLELSQLGATKGPVWLTWYDQTFSTGSLLNYDGIAVTDTSFSLTFTFDSVLATQNSHGIAVWRDPLQNDYSTQSYTITVRETPADLTTNQPSQWAAPLVPRPTNDATTVWAPEPTTLSGDHATTYINFSLTNDSVIPALVPFYVSTAIDGSYAGGQYYPFMGAHVTSIVRPTTGQIVRGGRHTLSMQIDTADDVLEFSEANNAYATQYVWGPSYLAFGTSVTRSAPPDRTGGWSLLNPQEVHWYNCDAQRPGTWNPSGTDSYWGAVAILPGATNDFDLDLHERTLNPRHSFEAPLASSQWSEGQSEFVLMNFHNTAIREYDVGIVRADVSSDGSYKITTASSVGLPADPDGYLGTFNMSSQELVQLYEIDFTTAGNYQAQMMVDNPALSMGFSLYGPSLVHGGKSDVLSETAAGWLYDGSGIYSFDFAIAPGETGKHCLAVWKAAANLTQSSDYTMSIISEGTSAVDTPELPAVTRLTGAYPNPFNPLTMIGFALAENAQTRVTIHDLMGRRLATLIDAHLPAGRHSVIWQGQDDAGRRVASGTYFVQFLAQDVRETKKLMLVK